MIKFSTILFLLMFVYLDYLYNLKAKKSLKKIINKKRDKIIVKYGTSEIIMK